MGLERPVDVFQNGKARLVICLRGPLELGEGARSEIVGRSEDFGVVVSVGGHGSIMTKPSRKSSISGRSTS